MTQHQSDAYDMVDRYLRNNMDDVDYEIYSQALDVLAKGCAQAPKSDNPDFITIPAEYQYAYPDGRWYCSNGVTINGDNPVRARSVRKKGLDVMDILKRIDFVMQFAKEYADGAWSIKTDKWKHHVTPEFVEDVRQYIVALQLKLMHEQTKQAALRQAIAQPEACTWTETDDEDGIWSSSCGELWSFIDGGPKENRVSYCHNCGKKVEVKP